MDIITFLILSLATWRISSLLTNPEEMGPYRVLSSIRYRVGVRFNERSEVYSTNEIAEIFTCLWCMSIWIGVILTILWLVIPTYITILCLPFAFSTLAIVIEEIKK